MTKFSLRSKKHASHPRQHPASIPATHFVAYDDIEAVFECWSVP